MAVIPVTPTLAWWYLGVPINYSEFAKEVLCKAADIGKVRDAEVVQIVNRAPFAPPIVQMD